MPTPAETSLDALMHSVLERLAQAKSTLSESGYPAMHFPHWRRVDGPCDIMTGTVLSCGNELGKTFWYAKNCPELHIMGAANPAYVIVSAVFLPAFHDCILDVTPTVLAEVEPSITEFVERVIAGGSQSQE